MTINLNVPDIRELKPRITVFGVGGAGGNAVNNMITAGLQGIEFVVANTDAQALTMSKAERIVQMGTQVTQGLGAGSQPDVGAAAAQEVIDEIRDHLSGANMVFVTAGMGGGTGTGAAPVIAKTARDMGILTVGVVTKPFHFEGQRRMRTADSGIAELHQAVDTLLIIPNQNRSVVATGIEQALISRNATAPAGTNAGIASPDTRLADLTARLRADNQRLAERAQKLEASNAGPAAPAAPRASGSVERAALAAIAAAVAPEVPVGAAPLQAASYGDVTVRPIAQKPSLFPDAARVETHEPAMPDTFIPQPAERGPARAPRMPKFEDLPMPAQK